MLALGAALLLAAAALVLARDEPDASPVAAPGLASAEGLYRLTLPSSPSASPVNRLHTWPLVLRDADGAPVPGASIAVDGDMPAHGHGLPTRPVARDLGGGRYALEGMKFQMSGAWYVELRIDAGPGQDTARVDFVLSGG